MLLARMPILLTYSFLGSGALALERVGLGACWVLEEGAFVCACAAFDRAEASPWGEEGMLSSQAGGDEARKAFCAVERDASGWSVAEVYET